MDRENSRQLDFLSQAGKFTATAESSSRASFFIQIRGHEKIILLIIGIVIISIIAFSLGVEKGKRVVIRAIYEKYKKPPVSPNVDMRVAIMPAVISAMPTVTPAPKGKVTVGSYTIQIASYLNRASAQNEAQALRKKGLQAIIAPKGKYTAVCVGSFPSFQDAQTYTGEIRKLTNYRDFMIRRL